MGAARVDFDLVSARLAQAGATLLALQVSGLRPAGFGSTMPTPADAVADDRRPGAPTPRQISEMDEALSWVSLLPAERLALRRLVHARALVSPRSGKPLYSWRVLGRWLGCSDHTAKTWWIGAIDLIVRRLNAPLLCQDPRFRGTRHVAVAALEHAAQKAALQPIERLRRLEPA